MRKRLRATPGLYAQGNKRRRAHPEEIFHMQVADYLRRALPLDVVWTTFPAGGGGRIRGAKLKRMGLRAGVWDIVLWRGNKTLWLELKSKTGSLSELQRDFRDDVIGYCGHCVAVCRSLEEIEHALAWIAPDLRARLAA